MSYDARTCTHGHAQRLSGNVLSWTTRACGPWQALVQLRPDIHRREGLTPLARTGSPRAQTGRRVRACQT
jgi:hypothetical protein